VGVVSREKRGEKWFWLTSIIELRRETVQQVIAQTNVQSNLANAKIFVARPAPGQPDDRILPVDWQEITSGPGTTNHSLQPGHRVFVVTLPFWMRMLQHAAPLFGL